MSSTKTQLSVDQTYEISGVTLTGQEILDNAIDAAFLKGKLSRLLGDSE
jgi:hypothetical protein